MGLRAKFNLMLLAVAILGIVAFGITLGTLVQGVAREEVIQNSRIMMEGAAGARKYTSEEIAPILRQQMSTTFHPQSVSAFAAKKTFDVLHAKFPEYSYREAALNPTNLEDRANDWEADIVNDFRARPAEKEIVTERDTPLGRSLNLARPIVAEPACLECHSTPQAAPRSMLVIYGPRNGFGWKVGETIGAQIVTVPMAVSQNRAARIGALLMIPLAAVFILLALLLNVLLGAMVIGPIDRMTDTAEAVSLGDVDAPEYVREGSDQIARLSAAFNRMRRSLAEALRMLGPQ